MPRPFAERDGKWQAHPADSVGVVVAEPSGIPTAMRSPLRDAMIEALQAREVPASAEGGNRASYWLMAEGETPDRGDRETGLRLRWHLFDSGGALIRTVEHPDSVTQAAWQTGAPDVAADIAGAVAPMLTRLLRNREVGGQNAPPAQGPGIARLFILPVEGAPGDGRETLTRALKLSLRSRGLGVTDRLDDSDLLIFGDVLVSAAAPGQQRVEISWAVRWPDGNEVGRIDQANNMPAGQLDHAWGMVAGLVAEGAAAGIADLLRKPGVLTARGGS
jgi:hypothetical protein